MRRRDRGWREEGARGARGRRPWTFHECNCERRQKGGGKSQWRDGGSGSGRLCFSPGSPAAKSGRLCRCSSPVCKALLPLSLDDAQKQQHTIYCLAWAAAAGHAQVKIRSPPRCVSGRQWLAVSAFSSASITRLEWPTQVIAVARCQIWDSGAILKMAETLLEVKPHHYSDVPALQFFFFIRLIPTQIWCLNIVSVVLIVWQFPGISITMTRNHKWQTSKMRTTRPANWSHAARKISVQYLLQQSSTDVDHLIRCLPWHEYGTNSVVQGWANCLTGGASLGYKMCQRGWRSSRWMESIREKNREESI